MEEIQVQYFQVFHEVARAVLSVLNVKAVLHLIAKRIVSPLGVKASALMLLDQETHRLELVASHGLSDRYLRKGPLDADRSITDALSGRPVLIESAPTDPRVQYRKEEIDFAKVLAEISGIAIINAKLQQERTDDIAFWKATLEYLGIKNS